MGLLNVSITAYEKLLNDLVRTGEFRNASEAVRHAIRHTFIDHVAVPKGAKIKIVLDDTVTAQRVTPANGKRLGRPPGTRDGSDIVNLPVTTPPSAA